MAAQKREGPLLIVTDSQYVARGLKKLREGSMGFEGKHGELWAALRDAGGGDEVWARWIPAHREQPDPPLLTEEDWRGNHRADKAAGAAVCAALCDPATAQLAFRRELQAKAVGRVMAAVQVAQLAWARATNSEGVPRIARGKSNRHPKVWGSRAPVAPRVAAVTAGRGLLDLGPPPSGGA